MKRCVFAGSQEDMLRRAIRVEATAATTPDGVRLTVRVRADDVGHRVPTGFIDRHLILVIDEGVVAPGVPDRNPADETGWLWRAGAGR